MRKLDGMITDAQTRTARDRRPRALAASLAAIILSYYLALGGNSGFLAMAGAALSLFTAILTLLALEPRSEYWRVAWPGLAAVGVLNLWAAAPAWLSTPSQFVAPDLYNFGMAKMFGTSAMLLAGSWVGFRRSGLRYCVLALVCVGTIDIIVGLVIREISPFQVWGISKGINAYRFTGTLLNANASACLFSVTAILAVGTLQDSLLYPVRNGLRSYMPTVMIAVALLATGACAITGSRTALMLTLVALAVMLAKDPIVRRMVFNRHGLFVLGGIMLMLVTILIVVGDTTFDRVALLGGDLADRLAIWSQYIKVARHAPWLGYGPASFGQVSQLAMETPQDARLLWYVNSPHNIILSIIIEHGMGFSLLVGIAGLTIFAPILARESRSTRAPVRLSALVACVVILCCAFVDIALDVPAVMALFALLVGLIWGQELRIQVSTRQSAR